MYRKVVSQNRKENENKLNHEGLLNCRSKLLELKLIFASQLGMKRKTFLNEGKKKTAINTYLKWTVGCNLWLSVCSQVQRQTKPPADEFCDTSFHRTIEDIKTCNKIILYHRTNERFSFMTLSLLISWKYLNK